MADSVETMDESSAPGETGEHGPKERGPARFARPVLIAAAVVAVVCIALLVIIFLLDTFNATARDDALAAGVHWVDVTAISRRHGADPGFLADDGLHPSPAAYAEWTESIGPVAIAALAERGGED